MWATIEKFRMSARLMQCQSSTVGRGAPAGQKAPARGRSAVERGVVGDVGAGLQGDTRADAGVGADPGSGADYTVAEDRARPDLDALPENSALHARILGDAASVAHHGQGTHPGPRPHLDTG